MSYVVIEGPGKEVASYAGQHPDERFRLVLLDKSSAVSFNHGKWSESLSIIATLASKSVSLPDDAFSTDALYD